MTRATWSLGLGIALCGTSFAQPTPETERFPLAPEMPGVVVSQPSTGARPVVNVTSMYMKPTTSVNTAAPKILPLPTAPKGPYLNTATTTILPANSQVVIPPTSQPVATGTPITTQVMSAPMMMAAPVMEVPVQHGPFMTAAPVGGCTTPACGGTNVPNADQLTNWFKFQSTSKQTGFYAAPYTPPLQAWFPCKESKGGCGTPAMAGCANGNCAQPQLAGQAPMLPVAIVPGMSQQPVHPNVVPVYNVEMVPVGPYGATAMPAPKLQPVPMVPQVDPLANFRKLEGVSFTPGGSPMAAPTRAMLRMK